MSKFENDLSKGNVVKQLLMFSLPFLISTLLQSLYNVADMFIVGKFSGPVSISGVNIGGQLTFIVTNIVVGLCAGGTVLISQYVGSKDHQGIKETTATIASTLLVSAVIVTIGLLLTKDLLLTLINTPEESYQESSNYLAVTSIGIIFIFGYNALSAIMRGMGDSKRPLFFVAIACVINIILDVILVGVFDMKAFGAAVATVISQAISMFLCIWYMIKNKFVFDFKLSSFRFYKNRLKLMFKIGLPSAVQNGVTSLSFLFITALVNEIGGYTASAAVGIVGRFNGFAIMPAIAMGASVSTMSAQNIGAGEWDRAKKTCRIGVIIAVAFSYSIFVIAQLFPEQILGIFDDNKIMIEQGVTYFRTFSFDYLVVPLVFCINGLFVASGHTMFSLINSMMSSILLRVPVAYVFGQFLGMGLFGIGLGAPIASLGSLLVVLWFYFSKKWMINVIQK